MLYYKFALWEYPSKYPQAISEEVSTFAYFFPIWQHFSSWRWLSQSNRNLTVGGFLAACNNTVAWEANQCCDKKSDLKLLFFLFCVFFVTQVQMIDEFRQQAIVEEETRNLDRLENDSLPVAKLSSNEVCSSSFITFGDLLYCFGKKAFHKSCKICKALHVCFSQISKVSSSCLLLACLLSINISF